MRGTHQVKQNPLGPPAGDRPLSGHCRDVQHRSDLGPSWITAGLGALILGAYLALWLSTRHQHPYRGPSLGVVGLVYAGVAVCAAVAAISRRRARVESSVLWVDQSKIERIGLAISVVGSPVIQGAMKHYGADDAIVYGVIPAAGPPIVIGTTLIGIAVAKSDGPRFGAAVVVVMAGIVAAFAGPSAAWLSAGIGLLIAVEGYAVATGCRPAKAKWLSNRPVR